MRKAAAKTLREIGGALAVEPLIFCWEYACLQSCIVNIHAPFYPPVDFLIQCTKETKVRPAPTTVKDQSGSPPPNEVPTGSPIMATPRPANINCQTCVLLAESISR